METLLQLVGSIASIISIPLAIYIFLRQKEAQHYRLRQSIIRTLSYQIGEGRNLSNFEIKAVIEAKSREFRSKSSSITKEEIIEDLASETISNPMLQGERKEEIILNLNSMYASTLSSQLVENYRISPKVLVDMLSEKGELTDEDKNKLETKTKEIEELHKKKAAYEAFSSTFGAIASFVSIFAVLLSISSDASNYVNKILSINFPEWVSGVVLGSISSLIAGIITGIALKNRKLERNKK